MTRGNRSTLSNVLEANEHQGSIEPQSDSGEDLARRVDSDLSRLTDIYTGKEIVVADAGQTATENAVDRA